MPQNRKLVKSSTGAVTKVKQASSHKIGTRSSGVAGNLMSNDALRNVLADDNKKRYHNKARNVLNARGVIL